jgi:tetratricopeptide (TPR) repeat protein
MKRLNLVFLAVLLATTTVLGGLTHLVHELQVRRHASAYLDLARRADAAGELERAAGALEVYLNLLPKDATAWARYARLMDKRDWDHFQREQVFLIYGTAQRLNPGDAALERRGADLALELGRYLDAQQRFEALLAKVPADSQGRPAAAELEELVGRSVWGLGQYEEAERWFLRALEHDRARVSAYDRLARLRRADLRHTEAGDRTIREMVKQNPEAGRAYLYRWRYARQFGTPADPDDLATSLRLAPDDPEVLLAAAVASERDEDTAAARAHYEKGCRLHPQDLAFVLGLAGLETRDGHLDRAEAVLRRAHHATPSVELTFLLAENLICQDKVDGQGQAAEYITRLRDAGLGLDQTLIRYLEARILFQRKQWAEAIPKIEAARLNLRSSPQLTVALDLMLAECHGHMGSDEQRLATLRQVAKDGVAPESARIELVRALAFAGRLDQAAAALLPLAERRPEWRLDLVRLLIQRASRQPTDQRNWPEVERALAEAEKALPRANEPLVLLRAELLAAQGHLEEARSLLAAARVKAPGSLRYRLALAGLARRRGDGAAALQILDQAEKDLGPSPDLQLARLDDWGRAGGEPARAAVARLAATRQQVPAAVRPAFLERLASAEIALGEPARAREHLRELAGLQSDNLQVLMALFDLASEAADDADARDLVASIRAIERDQGTNWRLTQATWLLNQARRDGTRDLEGPRGLAAEIAARRPDWWGSDILLAEIAELEGRTDAAIGHYNRAIELGNNQPQVARRLVGLLTQNNQPDQVERLVKILADRGVVTGEVTLAAALQAIGRKEYERGLALARQVHPASSTYFGDHLVLAQLYLAAQRPQEAGQELRRAVELGPAVPLTWVSYVRYLVQAQRLDQARATVDAARKALAADRAGLALAQCYAMVGDAQQAAAMIQAAVAAPTCELTTIRAAAELCLDLGLPDQIELVLDKLRAPALKATPGDLTWANRTRVRALMGTGRPADVDRALALVTKNLRADPTSPVDQRFKALLLSLPGRRGRGVPSCPVDQRFKALLLSLRTSRRGDSIQLLEPLEAANQLHTSEQFVLAQAYLAERLLDKYRAQMLKILGAGARDPRHLFQFVDFLIGQKELDQANRWLAEFGRVAPGSLDLLELEARLLKARNRDDELRERLQARGRQVPAELGAVANMLDRFGFAREAETAYKDLIARHPDQPERLLVLASFLARQDRTAEAVALLGRAWATCRPEAVAMIARPLWEAPSAGEDVKHQVETWVAEAIRRRPTAAAGLRPELAGIYMHRGRYDEAEALLREALRGDPDHVVALNNLAWLLALRGRGKAGEALALINRAIDISGTSPTLVDTRAVALIRAGQLDRAARELRDAQALAPKNLSLPLHLAWAYQEAGQTDEALKAFGRARELGLKSETRDPLERGIIARLCQQLMTDSPPSSTRR